MRSVAIIVPLLLSTVAVAAVQQGRNGAAPAAAIQVSSQSAKGRFARPAGIGD
jgi:hypothetical protein